MAADQRRYDLILRNGLIVDGTGASAIKGDIAIRNGKIVKRGELKDVQARYEKDVSGFMVCPGFIDVHAHDDRAILSSPDMLPKLSQGVTTVISGNCGISLAPLILEQKPPPPLNVLGDESWYRFKRVADYVEAVNETHPNINIALLIGHSTLRMGAMKDLSKKATTQEIDLMRQRLREGLTVGAIGFSTGLFYATNKAADMQEVVALAELLADMGGVYTTHMRDEFDGVEESLKESFETARLAHVPLVISHYKCGGPKNWGRSVDTLRLIHQAQQHQKIGLDVYPYIAGSTIIIPDLVDGVIQILITGSSPHPEMTGKYLSDIAKEWGCTEKEAAKRLMPGGACYFQMDEGDVCRILKFPSTMIGSDGLPHDCHPHPRLWGAFPRVIGHYARDLQLFTLEEAVRKMTSLPAEQFALKNRGILREGAYADIVVFDPNTILDTATFENPTQTARGIEMVIVNGKIAWQDGVETGARSGCFIPQGVHRHE